MEFPCSDYIETRGVVFFARMLHKIRLQAAGRLPPGYNLGLSDASCFDARFCRFWEVDYDQIRTLTLEGRSDEQVFDAIFGSRPLNAERILAWNGFLTKRGWRDNMSTEIAQLKATAGLAHRDDIQTYVDYHDVDEGRQPRFA